MLGIDRIKELPVGLVRLKQEYDAKINLVKAKAKLAVSPNKAWLKAK